MNKKFVRTILPIVLLILGVVVYYLKNSNTNNVIPTNKGFDRTITPIIYTKHAKCRMGCRHIDEEEVKDILHNGTINYKKSQPNSKPDPKYALEGYTKDNQHVRIIFAPTGRGMVVITCIDVNEEWQCDCK